ncbi:alpha/beta-hydrolase [Patellaria atrata CBS 101060]|uniref:Alpha/beta-hydrolase n=1 Tax=Patellaria atrata CBS 101060 TaxID=1346257 RepID=A0A9P4S2S3_9PEZI|nr:alpha/beta-hydrolase [Patellaria atrata CBS 101060]
MTVFLFGRDIRGRRKPSGPVVAQPYLPVHQAPQSNGYRPSQTTTALHAPGAGGGVGVGAYYPPHQPPVQHYVHSPHPSWSPPPGPYHHRPHPQAAVSQTNLAPSAPPLYPPRPSYATQSASQVSQYPNKEHGCKWTSTTNLKSTLGGPLNIAAASLNDLSETLHQKTTIGMNQTAALCDVIASKLNAVITLIDEEGFSGEEKDLIVYSTSPGSYGPSAEPTRALTPGGTTKPVGSNYFSKVWLYTNSRLPPHLPPFKIYLPTYRMLCLAAQYSEAVYKTPTNPIERETHIEADWRAGTKAMTLKSLPLDDMNTIVFAIRGSQTFMDWAVNFRPAPSSPRGFLDDEGNLCHSGFLGVAKKMVAPVAARLKGLLEGDPNLATYSLLITGHSAGGAVAQLLYAHMLSTTVQSDLNHLTGFFKRVHCITFGAPPVSLLPLDKPHSLKYRKSLFYSFVNEGDPVPRADKKVVKSLLSLYASPTPGACGSTALLPAEVSKPPKGTKIRNSRLHWPSHPQRPPRPSPLPTWTVPPSTLSCGGRLVLLRAMHGTRDVEAVQVTDEQLRKVVFGDPVCHMMSLYARRVEILATLAVTGRLGSRG